MRYALFFVIVFSGCRLFGPGTENNENNLKDVSGFDIGNIEPDVGSKDDMRQPDMVTADADMSALTQPNLPARLQTDRVEDGLIFLFEFKEGMGTETVDAIDPTFRLSFSAGLVEWIPNRNGVRVDGPGFLSSDIPHLPFYEHVTNTERFSVELWVRPGNNTQSGPSRIMTIAPDGSRSNFTFGQSADRYSIRFRHTAPDDFGTNLGYPLIQSPDATLQLEVTHLVMTFDGVTARLYENGLEVGSEIRAGSMSNWNAGWRLGLGNEFTDARNWAGDIYLVAAYDHALSVDEVRKNFLFGSEL